MGTDHLHIKFRERDSHAELIETLADQKGRETGDKRDLPAGGQPGGDSDEIRFLDSDIKNPFREFFLKKGRLGGLGKIGVQHDDIRIDPADLDKRFAVSVPGGFA